MTLLLQSPILRSRFSSLVSGPLNLLMTVSLSNGEA